MRDSRETICYIELDSTNEMQPQTWPSGNCHKPFNVRSHKFNTSTHIYVYMNFILSLKAIYLNTRGWSEGLKHVRDIVETNKICWY